MIWLILLTIMVLLIIMIGGLTRLTDSGLSMVDWQPLLGTIPPLNKSQWMRVFNDYQLTPEFLYVNKNMTLEEFKYIFWWEWFHRFFARCIGLVFILPFLYFWFNNYSIKCICISDKELFISGAENPEELTEHRSYSKERTRFQFYRSL